MKIVKSKHIFSFIVSLLIFPLFGCNSTLSNGDEHHKDEKNEYSNIVINEICSKNRSTFIDKYGESSDWIELFNANDFDVNIKGCGLSNKLNDPFLLRFDDLIIGSKNYLLIAVSGREVKCFDGEYHAPFTLSNSKNGVISFSSPAGICSYVNYPALKDDVSFGFIGDELTTLIPSPGRNNEEIYIEKQTLLPPSFSKESGFYENEFHLSLSSPNNCRIYYTLDHETPNEKSLLYENPILIYNNTFEDNVLSARNDVCGSKAPFTPIKPVNKCMVVRAICYDDYGYYSPVVSASYWVGQNDFFMKEVPVLSLSTDFDNLFGRERGIYCRGKIWDDWFSSDEYDPSIGYWEQPANYLQKGFEWERIANLTFLNGRHKVQCEQLVGMRIKGGSSRGLPKKSFNIFSRFLYDGNSRFTYKFNGKKCESITLRSGGSDAAFFPKDSINSMIAEQHNLHFETQDNTPTYLFLNGEFWGVYMIADKYDSRFIKEKYNIEDSIIWKTGSIEEGFNTDISLFNEAKLTICQDLLTKTGFDTFCNYYSILSITDIILFHAYIDQYDFDLFWSNSAAWRSRNIGSSAKKDGLIRFILYDTELSLGKHFDYTHYPRLFDVFSANNSLKYLLESPYFVQTMKERAAEMVAMLSSDECIQSVSDYYYKLEPLISQNNLRFFGNEDAGHTETWNQTLDFLKNRGKYFLEIINNL